MNFSFVVTGGYETSGNILKIQVRQKALEAMADRMTLAFRVESQRQLIFLW